MVRGGTLGIRKGGATLFALLWSRLLRRGQRGNNAAWSALVPHSMTSLPSHKWIVNSPVRPGVSLTATSPTDFLHPGFWVFSFPCWNSGFCGLASPLFLSACLGMNVWPPMQSASCCLAAPLLSIPAALSAPTTSLDECFFNSLVIRHPCKWFSGSFGCFLFLNWLFSFFYLCKEAKCFCLHLHLSQNSLFITL